jgi:hypothetical protein
MKVSTSVFRLTESLLPGFLRPPYNPVNKVNSLFLEDHVAAARFTYHQLMLFCHGLQIFNPPVTEIGSHLVESFAGFVYL